MTYTYFKEKFGKISVINMHAPILYADDRNENMLYANY